MLRQTWEKYKWLLVVFVAVFGIRLYFSFQTPYLSSTESYFHLTQISHIVEQGVPLYDDPLSYGGRTHLFLPLYHYIMAFFGLFLSTALVAKVVSNLFATLVVVIVYGIAKYMTNNQSASLCTAFLCGFVPIYVNTTFNHFNIYTLVIPLFFFLLYCFLHIDNETYVQWYILGLVLLSFMHPIVFVFILGLLFYLLLAKVERLSQRPGETELILFSAFFGLWTQFLVFKKILLFHGPGVVWQNIPLPLLSNYFSKLTSVGLLTHIGILPLCCGLYVIYRYAFKEKKADVYLLFSFISVVTLLLWLRLIKLDVGLVFIGLFLAILFGPFYKLFFLYFHKTKISSFSLIFSLSFVVLIILTSIIPSVIHTAGTIGDAVTPEEVSAMKWLKENTPEDVTIAAPLEDGHLITALAQRKNIIDTRFLYVEGANERYQDIETIFKSSFTTETVRLFDKYNATYLYVSRAAIFDPTAELVKFRDASCFNLVFNDVVKVYEVICHIEVIS